MIHVTILTSIWNYQTSPFLSDVKLLNRIDRFTWKTSNLYDNSVYMKRVSSESEQLIRANQAGTSTVWTSQETSLQDHL